jgi:hypothetical protein
MTMFPTPADGYLTGISIFNSDSPLHRHQGFANAKFELEFVPEGPFHYAPTGWTSVCA